ncbi:SDR family oxidoreductase [Streptomyces sp. HUAS MG91]|uniref:SDR family oxidoreductase n=1 Tax=Streptomyces tabacisoli TaxID=3156398 RepID=A0AAU8J408_9ACTN
MSDTIKIAIVTGSSRGIGRSIALALAQEGQDVIVTYRSNTQEAENVVKAIQGVGRKAVALQQDVGDTSSFDASVEQIRAALKDNWGRETFDYLVNNAGIGITKPFAALTEDDFDAMANVHIKGVVFLTQKLLPLMNDGGGIVNISSGLTRVTAPAAGGYAMMKGAVEVYTRHLAAEVGPRGITVNAVAPGPTATDFGGGLMKDENVQVGMGQMSVFGEIGTPDNIGSTVAAVLSGGMHRVTAQRIEVGGFSV